MGAPATGTDPSPAVAARRSQAALVITKRPCHPAHERSADADGWRRRRGKAEKWRSAGGAGYVPKTAREASVRAVRRAGCLASAVSAGTTSPGAGKSGILSTSVCPAFGLPGVEESPAAFPAGGSAGDANPITPPRAYSPSRHRVRLAPGAGGDSTFGVVVKRAPGRAGPGVSSWLVGVRRAFVLLVVASCTAVACGGDDDGESGSATTVARVPVRGNVNEVLELGQLAPQTGPFASMVSSGPPPFRWPSRRSTPPAA
jgi:hypothetical protein